MVFAFGHGQAQGGAVDLLGCHRSDRRRFIVQLHAGEQIGDTFRCQGMACADPIHLRNVALAGGQAVIQLAVVGQQQNSGRVGIKPADRLHATVAQRGGDQFEDRAMVLRLARTFVTCRFVQDQCGVGLKLPGFVSDGKVQTSSGKFGEGVGASFAIHCHQMVPDHGAAFLAGAEPLRL